MQNWDDLRIFLSVARAGRVAPAARQLGIDPTTVSRRLARLERMIDDPLFETSNGQRVLTDAGLALHLQAETMETALLAVGTPTTAPTGIAGHVRLSLAEGFATCIVAPAVAAFARAHPRLRLDLITASGFLDPSKREADIAVMLARPRGRSLRAAPLTDYSLRLYATTDYLTANGAPTTPAELLDHTLVNYVEEHLHSLELDYLSEIHPNLIAGLRSTSINVQTAMIRAGAGIGILPDFVARDHAELVPVLAGTVQLQRSFWIVTHEDTNASPRVAAVSNWLRETARRQ